MMLDDVELISLNEVDDYENPLIVAHYTHPSGAEWHIIAGDPINNNTDLLCFGVGKITVSEMGEFTLKEIINVGAIRDNEWTPKGLYDVFPQWKY